MAMSIHTNLPGLAEKPEVRRDLHHILVVDDDPYVVHLMKENLECEGHTVVCAYDGQMALRLARQWPFHLIVLDVNMPITNGLKVFELLRASHDTWKIPVIFVTGEPTQNVYPAIAQAQRVAHLKKPLDLEDFSSLVRFFLKSYPIG